MLPKLVAYISKCILLIIHGMPPYLTEQNSKLMDLKLKKFLEAQPQVALSGASQKAVAESSEQDIKVNLYLCNIWLSICFPVSISTL